MASLKTAKPAASIEANRLGNPEQLGGELKFQNSPKPIEPQHPATEKRRLDRAQFLSLAEVESRYGIQFDALLRLKPSFPRPIRIAGNPQPFFSRAGILCFEIEQRCKSRRGRAAQ